ncbi:MAG TPA: cell division protein FtsL [Gammaproteobacteria bacterium]|nr:cell division protein FtsL [Gammaproteobacteria bacterium]
MRLRGGPSLALIALAAIVVFGNALAVVYSAARNRALFSELNSLRDHREELMANRGRLELEEWTLAAHSRVADVATKKLHMQPPATVHIVEVP